jgi:hypothetical protein
VLRVRAGAWGTDLVRGADGIHRLVLALVSDLDERMTKYEIEFAQWKAEREKRARKVGAYWLTTKGRDEIRESFGEHDDGNCVLPLLDYVKRL